MKLNVLKLMLVFCLSYNMFINNLYAVFPQLYEGTDTYFFS